MIDLGPPIASHRLLGRADYRGWALIVDTDVGPGLVKRWTMGHNLLACATVWFWLFLGARWRGDRVLRFWITYIDRSGR